MNWETALAIAVVLGIAGTAFLIAMVRSMWKEYDRMHKANEEQRKRCERDINRRGYHG